MWSGSALVFVDQTAEDVDAFDTRRDTGGHRDGSQRTDRCVQTDTAVDKQCPILGTMPIVPNDVAGIHWRLTFGVTTGSDIGSSHTSHRGETRGVTNRPKPGAFVGIRRHERRP